MTEYVEIMVAGSDRPAMVDTRDAERVRAYHWCLSRNESGRICGARARINGRKVYLHRFILALTDPAVEADHKNLDVLDCRRSNLREATRQGNNANRRRPRNNTSGFKGVYWHKTQRRWHARIKVNGRKIHLGYFAAAEEAGHAYDDAARLSFGDFSRVNFPRAGERAA